MNAATAVVVGDIERHQPTIAIRQRASSLAARPRSSPTLPIPCIRYEAIAVCFLAVAVRDVVVVEVVPSGEDSEQSACVTSDQIVLVIRCERVPRYWHGADNRNPRTPNVAVTGVVAARIGGVE